MFIELSYLCSGLSCLPGPGGLFDQDSYLMWGIATVLAVRDKIEAKKAKPVQPSKLGR
jgi:hypothetical protein